MGAIMSELIPVHTNDEGIKTVNARSLHLFLEVGRDFSTWIKSRIDQYDFESGLDYCIRKTIPQNGGAAIEYYISLDMAKELSMVERNEKGKQARTYFIECERIAKTQTAPKELTRLEILQLALDSEQRAIAAESKVAILTHVNKTYTATEVAKEMGFKSATAMNKKLHEMKVQFKQGGTWVLYSKYADQGYVDIKQDVLDNGKIIYHRKWTQIGREFLLELLKCGGK